MPNINFKGHKKPWEKRANNGFKADGSAFTPFHNAKHSGDKRYDLKAWKTLRKRVLQNFPICPVCLDKGQLKPSEQVDHISPHRIEEFGFFNEGNLWALCRSCHSRKSAIESNNIAPPQGVANVRLWWIQRINKNRDLEPK